MSNRIDWEEIDASLVHIFARQVCAGKKIEDSDLFGVTEVIAGAGVYKADRLRLPTLSPHGVYSVHQTSLQ